MAVNFRTIETANEKRRAEELWFEAFENDNPQLRTAAARALGEMARTSPAATERLVAGLSDQKPGVRLAAIEGLEQAGPAARAARTPLMRIQNTDDNDMVRRRAIDLLATVQATPEGMSAKFGRLFYWVVGILIAAGALYFAFTTLRKQARVVRSSR